MFGEAEGTEHSRGAVDRSTVLRPGDLALYTRPQVFGRRGAMGHIGRFGLALKEIRSYSRWASWGLPAPALNAGSGGLLLHAVLPKEKGYRHVTICFGPETICLSLLIFSS